MLSKSFKSGKCKTSLKLGISRIKLLKNRRDGQVKQLRRELAQLLETGQDQTARIRVEHVIREEKTMSAYDLIEIYCELIVARMPIIESQKGCPVDLKEAISSVIFASPRCADIPELTDVRKQFVAKYGKEFVTSALELRPDSGVNRLIVEKLSAKTPDIDTKMKTLAAIAKEHEVKWDSKAFEELQKPKEDLLNGSSSLTGANRMQTESINVNLSPDTSQTEPAAKFYQTDIPMKTTSFGSSSQANLRTATLAPTPVPNESRESDGKASASEVKYSHPKEDTASFKQPTWKMEFKDAASAAQAAAESAERASIAARAAAELASRENISRQNSNEQNASFLHSSRDERPKRAVSSKLKSKINESVNMEYDQVKGFQGMNEVVHKPPRDELRDDISHHSSTSDEDIEYSSQMVNVGKFDSFRESFSRMEMGSKKKHEEAGFVEKNVQVNYDDEIWIPPIDQHQSSNHDNVGQNVQVNYDDEIWIPPIDQHQSSNHDNVGHNIHEVDAGEKLFRYDSNKEHDSSDYPSAVFDEYDPEPTDHKENLFDSFEKRQNDQPSIFAPSTSSINSSFFSSARHETHPVTVEKVPSSKFDDSISVAFDDSDGLTSESDDDDISSSRHNGTAQNSNLQHEESRLGRDSHPREVLQPSSSTTAKPLFGSEEKNHLQSSSSSVGVKDPETPDELATGDDEFGLKFGRLTGGLRNRGYSRPPYTASSVVDSPMSSLETSGSTISLIEKDLSSPIMSSPSNLESDKDKGSLSEEYNYVSRNSKTFSTNKSEEDDNASGFSVKQSVSNQENSRQYKGVDPNPLKKVTYDSTNNASTASEVINQKIYDEKPRTKAYKELSSRMSRTDFDSDVQEIDSLVNMESQANAGSTTLKKVTYDSTNNASTPSEVINQKIYDEKPRTKAYKELSSRMSRTDFHSDVQEIDSLVNMESQADEGSTTSFKLSRRTKDSSSKGPYLPRSTDMSRRSSAPDPPSQTADSATIVRGTQNRKSSKLNSSSESLPEFSAHEEDKKTARGIRDPDTATTSINSGNNKPSDSSGGGTKLQETASQHKASHVHPKLPDYETLAAHFHSLRSNKR